METTAPTDTATDMATPGQNTTPTETPVLSITDQVATAPALTTVSVGNVSTNTLQGNYTLKPINSPLPSITIAIGKGNIGFTGCNSVSLPFALQRGAFRLMSAPLFRGSRTCQTNNDIKYINLLRSANAFRFNGKTCDLSSKGRSVAQFIPVVKRVVRALPARNVSFRGRFHLSLVGTNITNVPTTIDTSKIAVGGCNQFPITYFASSIGGFRANHLGGLGPKLCSVNNDNRIISGITSGNKFYRNRTGLFLHRGANLVAVFRPIPIVVQRPAVAVPIPIARPVISTTVIQGPAFPAIPRIQITPAPRIVPAVPSITLARPTLVRRPRPVITKKFTTTSTSVGSGIVTIGASTPIPSGVVIGIPKVICNKVPHC
jgi:hypothetical protein